MLADITGAPLYVVHVSAKQALARIAEARNAGQNVFGETCPQYLYLSLEEQARRARQWGDSRARSGSARRRCARAPRATRTSCGSYIRTGDVTTVSTDHCPFCMKDQKEMGIGNFAKIPNGIGSVEHRMDLLFQGVRRRPDQPGALGRRLLHDAGAHVRPVRQEGRASRPAPTPTSSSTTRTGTRRSASAKTPTT